MIAITMIIMAAGFDQISGPCCRLEADVSALGEPADAAVTDGGVSAVAALVPTRAEEVESLACADPWLTLPDGTRRTWLGYESDAEGVCRIDPALETIPPAEPGSVEYVITKEDMAAAKLAKQNVLAYLFGDGARTVSRFNRLDPKFAHAGKKIRVPDLTDGQTEYTPLPAVYQPALTEPKYILIDLKRQFLGLYECGRLTASYPISSGTGVRGPKGENYRTPPGDYRVKAKNKDAKSSKYPEPDGGAPMPYAVSFKYPGYWMHGGDLVGYPASHGCIRQLYSEAPKVFAWARIGTFVRVVSSLD